jgi:hypothetical protein
VPRTQAAMQVLMMLNQALSTQQALEFMLGPQTVVLAPAVRAALIDMHQSLAGFQVSAGRAFATTMSEMENPYQEIAEG